MACLLCGLMNVDLRFHNNLREVICLQSLPTNLQLTMVLTRAQNCMASPLICVKLMDLSFAGSRSVTVRWDTCLYSTIAILSDTG